MYVLFSEGKRVRMERVSGEVEEESLLQSLCRWVAERASELRVRNRKAVVEFARSKLILSSEF